MAIVGSVKPIKAYMKRFDLICYDGPQDVQGRVIGTYDFNKASDLASRFNRLVDHDQLNPNPQGPSYVVFEHKEVK